MSTTIDKSIASFFGMVYVGNMKDTRIIGYARVSTDDQDLSLQRAALEKYGVDSIVDEYGSGGKMDRPGWKAVMNAMRDGDTVVIWRLDRLGRTLTGVIETVEAMHKEGVNLVSLHEEINTGSAMGKAFFRIALVFAELERDLISERTKAGIKIRQAMGVRFGKLHSIKDNQKRLDAFRPYVDSGRALEMTPTRALEILNAADQEAKRIESVETFRRWRRAGFPGIE